MTTHVVVVGQTPPPTHGQAVMVEALMRMRSSEVTLHLVRLAFSSSLADIGRLKPRKLSELVSVIRAIHRTRRETGAPVLYVAVGGASLVPLIRDAIILATTRRWFSRVVLHVHGAGVGVVLAGLPKVVRRTILAVIGRPDIVIQLSDASPADGVALRAKRIITVPNGIPDLPAPAHVPGTRVRLLFLGTLREGKGVLVLLESLAQLTAAGLDVSLTLAGTPVSAEFGHQLAEAIATLGLSGRVSLPGHLDESAKQCALGGHDVFVFPSFYSGENLSVAIIEAMRAGLPVVAADWRGARDLVEDGSSGLLVEPRNTSLLTGALTRLFAQPELMTAMGLRGRERFAAAFTEDRFHVTMAACLLGEPV